MTTSLRVLTTSTLDSSPSVLLVSPNGSKTLVNCGEGCQRSFLESSSSLLSSSTLGNLRISTVTRICVTDLTHESVGGLPGMLLTSADVSTTSMEHVSMKLTKKQNMLKKQQYKNKYINRAKKLEGKQISQEGIDVWGPTGINKFIHSLRHFMKRKRFDIRVFEEGARSVCAFDSKNKHIQKNILGAHVNLTMIVDFM